jgi:NAD+ kinase
MTNWGVVCKPNAKNAIAIAKDAYELLGNHGKVCAEETFAKAIHVPGCTFKEMNKKADVVVTVGGDGTILMALSEIEKPVFAINSGGMGFLSEVESKYAREGLERIIAGKYNIEERAKLKVMVDGDRLPDAANEVTVQTARIAKILYLNLYVNGEMLESMGADGVIIATPTGSTSYSLSVGGPILDPSVDAMVIAPLAAFKLSARPWIIPLKRKVGIKIQPKSKDSKLVIDGRCATSVSSKNDIVITGSEKKARFIRFGESFYEMVRVKLMR